MRFAGTDPSGCGATVAHVLWEPQGGVRGRVGGPEHEDLSAEATDYRVVGPFTSMRIGGGHIGAYAAMALPFVLTLGPRRGRWFLWPVFIAIGLGGTYTLAVTFARTAYMAALGAGLVTGMGLLLASRRGRTTWPFAVVPIALLAAVLGMLGLTMM